MLATWNGESVDVELTPTDPAILPAWGAPSWRDEFDGDLSKWNLHDNSTVANQDLGAFYAKNVSIVADPTATGNRVLQISAAPLAKPVTIAGKSLTWGSGYMDTVGKFSQRYGRFAARIKFLEPLKSAGMWGAFWGRDDTGGGEADIYEAVGTHSAHPSATTGYPDDGGTYSTTVYEQTGAKTKTWYSGDNLYRIPTKPLYGWHEWAMEWTPGTIDTMVFYCDGQMMATVKNAGINRGFTSKMHLLLDNFIGSAWSGHPDANTTIPNLMLVDYVRVWTLPKASS